MKTPLHFILLGSSGLLYSCARIIRDYYEDKAIIKVIDTAYSPLRKKQAEEFGGASEYQSKQEIFAFLDTIDSPTILLSINNPYIIPLRFTENQLFTIINLHHALLPNHPGRNAEAWTIYNQDDIGGITWHYISGKGIDTGEIICKREVEISDKTTSLMLLRMCEKMAEESLKSLLPIEKLRKEDAEKQPSQEFSPKKAIEIPNEGYVNWDWTIEQISAFLRSLDYGGLNVLGKAKCVWNNTTYTIKKYSISNLDYISERTITLSEADEKICIEVLEKNKNLRMKLAKDL